MLYNFSRFGRKKGVVIPMVLASIGAAGSAIISTYGDPDNGEYKTEGIPISLCVHSSQNDYIISNFHNCLLFLLWCF